MKDSDYGPMIALGALLALGCVIAVLDWLLRRYPEWVFRRGARLLSAAEAQRLAAACPPGRFAPPPGFPGLPFGSILLPFDYLWTGLLLLGEPGSGKSIIVNRFLDGVLDLICRLRRAGRPGQVRVVVFDAKRDLTGRILARTPPDVPVHLALALDLRAARWRVAADYTTSADAEQLAAGLCAKSKAGDQNDFWCYAARAVTGAAIKGCMRADPAGWTLLDVKRICRSRRRLRLFLRRWADTRDVAEQYLGARSGRDVVATIGSYLDRYESILSCWGRAATSFSLRDFLDSDGVLVLALDDSASEAIKPLYALLVRRLTDLILARNDPARPTFLVLDEYALFGQGDLLPLALKGRSAGASITITAQDIHSLESAHGEKEARALLGCLLARGLLRVTSDATAKFMSDAVGEQEGYQYTTNVADGGGNRTVTRTEAIIRRPVVLADEFRTLPRPDWAAGTVSGYFTLPGVGAYRADVRFREGAPPPAGPPAPDYLPRPAADHTAPPFTPADLARLGIPDNPLTRRAFGVAGGPKPAK